MTLHTARQCTATPCRLHAVKAPFRRASALLLLLMALLCPAALAQAGPNLVQDGGFELGIASGTASYQSSYGAWTSPQGAAALLGMPYGQLPAYEGTAAMHVGDSFGSGYVEQTIATVAGHSYALSFAIIDWPGGATNSVQVTVSSAAGTDLSSNCSAPGGLSWGTHSLCFTASSSSSVVRIQNTSGASTIDDVRCTEVVPEIELAYSSLYFLAWNDVGSGGSLSGSFWYPDIPAGNPGFARFGSLAVGGYDGPPGMTIGKDLSGSAFAPPIGFNLTWTDSGSGSNLDGCFWVPVAPPGYRVLGHLMRNCGWANPPSPAEIVCVREDLCCPGTLGHRIYDDSGTGANSDFSAWDVVAPPGAIDVGAWVGHASHAPYAGPIWCLRAAAVAQLPVPTQNELASLIQAHGPIVHMHPNDVLMPDDPAAILDDPQTTVIGETLVNPGVYGSFAEVIHSAEQTSATTILDDMQTALAHPNAGAANYLMRLEYPMALKFGNLSRAKAYVRAQPVNGVITELQFWIFYPYNGAGKAYSSVSPWWSQTFNPTGTMGEHFSDWETIRVRVTNRDLNAPNTYKLIEVAMGRHDFEAVVAAGNPSLTLQGGHPVIFSADRSHAQYTQPGYLTYKTVYTSILGGTATLRTDLFDLSGAGAVLNAYADYQIVSSAWPSIVTDTPDWFFFGGQWGGFSSNSVSAQATIGPLGVYTYSEQEVNNGKPGLLRRNEFAVTVPFNANLGRLIPSTGTLSPAFDQHTTSYSMTVPTSTATINMLPMAMDHSAEIEVLMNGATYSIADGALLGQTSAALPLAQGVNHCYITVTVAGAVQTYQVDITREFEVLPHACGGVAIETSATSSARLGGHVETTISNYAGGIPLIGLGYTPSVPFCGCTIGHNWLVALVTNNYTLSIPNNPALSGVQIGIQGNGFLTPGGCASPAMSLTDTVLVTIQ